jgi:hypothetical protein
VNKPLINLFTEDEARLILGYINLSESEGMFSIDYHHGEEWHEVENGLIDKLREMYPEICREYGK